MKYKHLIAFGFILYLYDTSSNQPVNNEPFHFYETAELCQADLDVFKGIAPEWRGECKQQEEKKEAVGSSFKWWWQ